MLTEKQQAIVDSLVSEFTKMNQPTNVAKKGLLDWNEIYQEKDEWEKTKTEIDLKNKAFLSNAQLEVERITEMLDDEFKEYFYIYHPTNNNIKYGWTWYIVAYGKHWHDKTLRIEMNYKTVNVYDKSSTYHVSRIDGLYFNSSATDQPYNSIEELFKQSAVINTFKSYINK
jgi:hypothetical protein